MARYMEENDPFMAAAADLVEDVKLKRAEEEGRVWVPDEGVYTVGEDGNFEFVGSAQDVTDELTSIYERAYMAALETISELDEYGQ